MERATAELNNHRQSPRKVRLLAGLVRGKSVESAINTLMFAEKKAAAPIKKLIESALSSAKNRGMDPKNLIVKEITVNAGATLMRRRPMSRGRAFAIKKRVSNVFVALETGPAPKVKATKEEKAARKAEKIKS
mgnify:CR=1 FL=1